MAGVGTDLDCRKSKTCCFKLLQWIEILSEALSFGSSVVRKTLFRRSQHCFGAKQNTAAYHPTTLSSTLDGALQEQPWQRNYRFVNYWISNEMNDEVGRFDALEVYLELGILGILSWVCLKTFPGRYLVRMGRWRLRMPKENGRDQR